MAFGKCMDDVVLEYRRQFLSFSIYSHADVNRANTPAKLVSACETFRILFTCAYALAEGSCAKMLLHIPMVRA